MLYQKLNLKNGDILTDAHITNLENGIVNNANTLIASVELGVINSSTGDFGSSSYGKQYYRCSKFIKPVLNKLILNVSIDCQVKVYYYDANFKHISNDDYVNVTANTDFNISINNSKCQYVKFNFRKDENLTEFNIPVVLINGVVPIEFFNIKPAVDYVNLSIPVNMPNLNTTNSDQWILSDSYNLIEDVGILMLPKTYSNIGKATRLIIWCHGSGGKYTSSSTDFPDDTLDSSYWLSEGYAILDMNGYKQKHYFHPATSKCYENAYNWVIKNYNIYTNGVFLGGRSMGGGTCLQLIQDTKIPFIAHCSIAGLYNHMYYYGKSTCDRKTCSEQWGFSDDYPIWTTTNPCSQDEWDYLKRNWRQAIQYVPFMKGIRGLNEENIDEFFDACYFAYNNRSETKEYNFCKKLIYNMPVPSKLFAYYEDNTVIHERNSKVLQPMIQNGGQVCELRVLHTSSSNSHTAELHDANRNITVETVFGETVTASLIYVEILQFWRRYEKFI